MRLDFTGSVMLITECGPERPQISSVYIGECSECSFNLGIAKPVAQFGDLRLVAVVQVLPRAEDLDGGNARVLNSVSHADVSRWFTNRCVDST